MFAVTVEAGPTLTTAMTAGVGVAAEARGVTVTTEAGATTGGPGGSPLQPCMDGPVDAWPARL